jgi:glycerol-3-phosphate acyltransferase PlsX
MNPRIGVDLLGSDTPPELLLSAVIKELPDLERGAFLTLFGTEELFKNLPSSSPISRVIATEIITMEDEPLIAARRKKNSSIVLGMRMLKQRALDAFVSAGNTGALMASAHLNLPMLPKIARPALLTLLPTKNKDIAVLDVGANVTCKADHLLQFASMGLAYQKTRGIAHPTVGLLNIGSEAKKGTPELREAYQRLKLLNKDSALDAPIFIGNVEGRNAFQGEIDVLVTDGFSGNVFLKTAEGMAAFILDELQSSATEEGSPALKTLLSTLQKRLHYAEYPGAILCGVEGIVVKCHGDSSPSALLHSIRVATSLIEHCFLEKIKLALKALR